MKWFILTYCSTGLAILFIMVMAAKRDPSLLYGMGEKVQKHPLQFAIFALFAMVIAWPYFLFSGLKLYLKGK